MPTKETIKKWEKLYGNALRALKDGVPLDKVDAIIKKRTGGEVAGFAALSTLYEPDLPPSQFSHDAPPANDREGERVLARAQRRFGGKPESEMRDMVQRLGPKPSDDTVEETYWKARRALAAGVPMQQVNEIIRKRTGVDGFATLEQQIAPRTPYGEDFRGLGHTGALVRSAGQGVFGLGDEASAGLRAVGALVPGGMSPDEAYNAEIQRQRALQDEFAVQRPGQNMAGQITGAAVSGLGLAAVGAPLILPRLAGGLMTRVALGGATAAGAGAAGGVADEFGRQEGNPLERLQSGNYGAAAGTGAAVGGVLGAAGPVVGPPVRKVAGPLVRRVTGAGAEKALARNELIRVLRRSGIDPNDIENVILALPEGEVLADASGSARRSARSMVNLSPELDDTVVPQIARRQNRRGERMADELRESANARSRGRAEPRDLPGSSAQAREGLEEATETIRVHGYDEIEKANPVVFSMGDDWKKLLNSPEIKAAFKIRGFDIEEALQGRLTFREAQAIKGSLEREVEAARVAKDSFDFQRFKKAKDDFYELLKRDVPEYNETQRKMALVFAQEDALDAGRKAANANANELEAAFRKLKTQEEKDMFRAGMLDEWERKLTETATGSGTANKILSIDKEDAIARARARLEGKQPTGRGGQSERRLRVLFDDDEQLIEFLEAMSQEERWTRTANRIMGNSNTAGQVSDLAETSIPASVRQTAFEIASSIFDDKATRQGAAQIVGEVLLSTGSEAQARRVARLLREAGYAEARARTAVAVAAGQQRGLLFEEE